MRKRMMLGMIIGAMMLSVGCTTVSSSTTQDSSVGIFDTTKDEKLSFNLREICDRLYQKNKAEASENNNSSGDIFASLSRTGYISETPAGSTEVALEKELLESILNDDLSFFESGRIDANALITPDGEIHCVTLGVCDTKSNRYAYVVIDPNNLPGFMDNEEMKVDGINIAKEETRLGNNRIVVKEYIESEGASISLSDSIDIGIDKEGTGIWVVSDTNYVDKANDLVEYLLDREYNFSVDVK